MVKLSLEDIVSISNQVFADSIPHIENSLNDILKDSPIDKEIKQAILNSIVVSQKFSTDTTVALLAQLVNAQQD